jgi:hypothetical protein
MPDETTTGTDSSAEGHSEPARPDPPPYEPDTELIGYIEKGQKPPSRPPRPSEPVTTT